MIGPSLDSTHLIAYHSSPVQSAIVTVVYDLVLEYPKIYLSIRVAAAPPLFSYAYFLLGMQIAV